MNLPVSDIVRIARSEDFLHLSVDVVTERGLSPYLREKVLAEAQWRQSRGPEPPPSHSVRLTAAHPSVHREDLLAHHSRKGAAFQRRPGVLAYFTTGSQAMPLVQSHLRGASERAEATVGAELQGGYLAGVEKGLEAAHCQARHPLSPPREQLGWSRSRHCHATCCRSGSVWRPIEPGKPSAEAPLPPALYRCSAEIGELEAEFTLVARERRRDLHRIAPAGALPARRAPSARRNGVDESRGPERTLDYHRAHHVL